MLSGKFPANLGCPRSIQDHHGEALASNLISMPSPDSVEACYCQKTTTKYLAGEEDRRKPPLVINFEAFVWSTPVTPCRFVTSKRLPSILATTPNQDWPKSASQLAGKDCQNSGDIALSPELFRETATGSRYLRPPDHLLPTTLTENY